MTTLTPLIALPISTMSPFTRSTCRFSTSEGYREVFDEG